MVDCLVAHISGTSTSETNTFQSMDLRIALLCIFMVHTCDGCHVQRQQDSIVSLLAKSTRRLFVYSCAFKLS